MFPHSSVPAPHTAPQGTRPSADDSVAASEDLLFDFFDFFDRTIDDVFSYVEHRTRVRESAEDITLKLYFSLLQRQRFFWWRSKLNLPELFAMADTAIAGVVQWQEAAGGDLYAREIARTMPGNTEEEMLERANLILKALRKLPLREQKMAVIRFFLKWSTRKTAAAFALRTEVVEKAYEITLHHFIEQLEKEEAFRELSVEQTLGRIHPKMLSPEEKAKFRVAILEKFRAAQMSSLRYVMPVAAFLLVATTVAGGAGTLITDPLSAGKGIRTVAAAQVLLLSEKRDLRDTIIQAEETSHALAATFAEKDLALLSVNLLPPAIRQQLATETKVYRTIRDLQRQTILSNTIHSLVSFLP